MKKRIVGVRLPVMKKTTISVSLGAAIWLVLCISLVPAAAQQKSVAQSTTQGQPAISAPEATDQEGTPHGHVVIDGRQVLTVYEAVGTFMPEERADRIAQRMLADGVRLRLKSWKPALRPEEFHFWGTVFHGG
jgi:hypothetical protein